MGVTFAARGTRNFRTRLCRKGGAAFALGLLLAGSAVSCGARSGLDGGDYASGFAPAESSPGTGGAGARRGSSGGLGARSAGGSAAAGAPSLSCVSETVSIDDLRPTVTLLVDQSGSMRFPYPDQSSAQSRWDLVRNALLDPVHGVVETFQARLRFGIVFFTSRNGFSGGTCPILSEVHAATNNYAAIDTLFESLEPDDDTPTGESIAQVVREIQALPTHGPQAIVLVTDGDPDTCAEPDPQNGQANAVAATQGAYAAGIDLYVVGISSDISGQNLQQLANAGKGRPLDAVWGVDADAAPAFQASQDVTGLTAQLSDVLNRVALCEVALDRDVGANEIMGAQISLDGQSLVYGSPDGFVLEAPRRLRIVGQACQTLESQGKQLSVRISCD